MKPLSPPTENPGLTASDLFLNRGIRTYVVTVAADSSATAAADALANAGGTVASRTADTAASLRTVLDTLLADLDTAYLPTCSR